MFYRIGLAGNQFADSDSVVVSTDPEADSADVRGPVALVSRSLPCGGSISVQERVVFARRDRTVTSCCVRRGVVVVAVLGVVGLGVPVTAQPGRLASGNWTRGLAGAWGHSWTPGYGKTESDVAFAGFHPQLGRFVTDHLELYGEGTLLLYHQPGAAAAGGVAGIGGRYHFWNDRVWTPYVVGIAGLIWTDLDIPELDRVFNFQLVHGVGLRIVPPRGPGLIVEFRNHHISNAGTAGENLGVNAATVVAGVQWVLR